MKLSNIQAKEKPPKKKKISLDLPYHSLLSFIRDIAEKNDAFNSLREVEQRREIAYDSLILIQSKKVKGAYCQYWSDDLDESLYGVQSSFALSEKLNNHLPNCQVCARGAVMLSQIRLGNNIKPDDPNMTDGCKENLKGFGIEIMHRMESEYETSKYNLPYDVHTTEKLANILCNVLHNGTFVETDTTDYLVLWARK